MALTLGRLKPNAVMAYLAALSLFIPLVFTGISVAYGWRTLPFLTALPIPRRHIVASKYVAVALLIIGLQLLVIGLSWLVSGWQTYLITVVMTALVGYGACSFALLLHHGLGSKVAGTSVVVASLGINIPLQALSRPDTLAWLGDIELHVGLLGSVLGANVLGIAIMALSCYISILIFSRRDLTQIL